MNTQELKVEMVRHGDNNRSLAQRLNISEVSVSNKINEKIDWTKSEMLKILEDYELSSERFMEIFFNSEVS